MDKQIDILEKRINEKKELDKVKYYEENIAMFNITKNFIKDRNLLLYGGLALNLILPVKDRFYDEHEVPDYDFFSPNAIKHGKELANLYAKKGYTDIELKPGLHLGTYKLFVNYIGIADITNLPFKLFSKMKKISSDERDTILKKNQDLDLHIVPINFLRMSMHLELSRPNGFIERWEKVYKRMVLLYNNYPLLYDNCNKENIFSLESDEVYLDLIVYLKEYLKINIYPVFGSEILKIYLKESGYSLGSNYILDENMTAYDIISEKYDKTSYEIKVYLDKYLGNKKDIVIEKHIDIYNSEIIPNYHLILYKNRPLISVYESQACYAYKEKRGLSIASIDTYLSMMYSLLLIDNKYYNKDKIRCTINILLNLQKDNLKKKLDKHKLFSPFELKCYGYQLQLSDLKKKRFNKTIPFHIYKPKLK
jgi:hypothetical protein